MGRPTLPNPLAVAFGAALRLARNEQGKPTKALAKSAEITDGFWRLIESGRNHVSISKVPFLHNAFGARLDYEALTFFVSTLASSEETSKEQENRRATRATRLHENTAAVCSSLPSNHPFKIFLTKFLEPLETHSIPEMLFPKANRSLSIFNALELRGFPIRELIAATGLDKEAFRLLTSYADYNALLFPSSEEYSRRFLSDIPSLYKHMLDGVKDSITRYPRIFAPETSWEWEKTTQHGFEQLLAVCSLQHLITDVKNLIRYHFSYLWNEQFRKADFIVLDEPSPAPEEMQTRFWKNLKQALEKANTIESLKLLSNWQENYSGKTSFSGVSDETERRRLVDLFRSVSGGNDTPLFNAMWFYRITDGSVIGAGSHIDENTMKATHVKFLTFAECSAALSTIAANRKVF